MTTALLFADLAEPQIGFDFPQTLAEKYRPRRIEDFAGLNDKVQPNGDVIPGVKSILKGFAANPRNAAFLFCGPAGTGKTSMALALASEVQGFIHHIPAGNCTVDAIRDLAFSCWYVAPAGFKRHVIIIDEADQMSSAAQLACLSYLDGTNTIPDTVWIFTCNATDRLADRFLSRNRVLNFSTYGIQADAAKLLESVWDAETTAAKPNFARIIKDSTGNVRAALMALEMKILAGA